MSDSVQPHRRQPTRLLRPWDSPGKNTGVGCHCLLRCMKVKSASEVAQSCPTPSDPMDCSPPGPSVHGIFQARVLDPCKWEEVVKGAQLAKVGRSEEEDKVSSCPYVVVVQSLCCANTLCPLDCCTSCPVLYHLLDVAQTRVH